MTEEEWKTLRDLTDVSKKDVDIYGNDTLEITAKGDILCFRGAGKASGLDSVRFDLARNIALFRQWQIPFMNIFHISATANGFHTPMVTYAYELNNNTMTDSTDINTLHFERYEGGHNIPADVIERRYYRGIFNLLNLYIPIVDNWMVIDNMDVTPGIIGKGSANAGEMIINPDLWDVIQDQGKSHGK